MRLDKLIINNRTIRLSSKNNLIYSEKNSTGKTTFIRLLLYSMGFAIPSTKGVAFDSINLTLSLYNSNKHFILKRNLNHFKLIENNTLLLNGNILEHFNDVKATLFNIDNINLINNLLGLFYFDQEKGWTLLNRGRVIGNNGFHIQDFINAFISQTLEDYQSEIKDINKQNTFYRHLMYLVKMRSNVKLKISQNKNVIDDINNKLNVINLYISSLRKNIKELNNVKNSNSKFVSMLTNLGLKVHKKINNHTIIIPINSKTLNNFNLNKDIINIRIRRILFHLDKYEKRRRKLQRTLNSHGLLNLKNSINIIEQDIANMNTPIDTINSIIHNNKNRTKKLKRQVNNILNNSNIIMELFNIIIEFAKELGVDNKIESTTDFIFTKKLKRYSGAILHLIVFAYRLACLKLLEKHFNVYPPIILDSPLSGELDIKNAKRMFKLLKRHFNKNQLIVATTNKLNFVNWNKIIHMSHGIFHIK